MRYASLHTSAPDQAVDSHSAHKSVAASGPSPQVLLDCSSLRQIATNHLAESQQTSKPFPTTRDSLWRTFSDQSSTAHTTAPADGDKRRRSQSCAARYRKYLQPWEYGSAE